MLCKVEFRFDLISMARFQITSLSDLVGAGVIPKVFYIKERDVKSDPIAN